MKIAICEDHPEEAGGLVKIMEKWAVKQSVSLNITLYENAERFWFSYEPGVSFDALFLDVQMPGESGITLARKLRDRGDLIPVVFVTGIDDYISEGYDVQAVHYLLKPVKTEKIEECLNRIYRELGQEEPYLLLNTQEGAVKLLQREIVKVEVFTHRCVYTTIKGEYNALHSLKEAQERLYPGWFVRSHRSILVNLKHVEAITRDKVFLTGGQEALVSRRLYNELNEAFIRFYGSGEA